MQCLCKACENICINPQSNEINLNVIEVFENSLFLKCKNHNDVVVFITLVKQSEEHIANRLFEFINN